ncbi:MAG: hypothetical protein AAFX87_04845 [Bacteroidota bacterium]
MASPFDISENMDEKHYFQQLRNLLCLESSTIEAGKMMSSPAITFKGKVFCFLSRKHSMVFKLGQELSDELIACVSPFAPFKTKPPMKVWWESSLDQSGNWEMLSRQALEVVKTEQL